MKGEAQLILKIREVILRVWPHPGRHILLFCPWSLCTLKDAGNLIKALITPEQTGSRRYNLCWCNNLYPKHHLLNTNTLSQGRAHLSLLWKLRFADKATYLWTEIRHFFMAALPPFLPPFLSFPLSSDGASDPALPPSMPSTCTTKETEALMYCAPPPSFPCSIGSLGHALLVSLPSAVSLLHPWQFNVSDTQAGPVCTWELQPWPVSLQGWSGRG